MNVTKTDWIHNLPCDTLGTGTPPAPRASHPAIINSSTKEPHANLQQHLHC